MAIHLRTFTCALVILSQFTVFFERIAPAQARRPARPHMTETKKGLQLKLSEGAPVEERAARPPVAPATRLSDAETQNVLKRLRPIKTEPDDQQDSALRDRSLPAPRTGKTISESFPPTEKIS